jgi:hypothetical protein
VKELVHATHVLLARRATIYYSCTEQLASLPVKQASLTISNPVEEADQNYQASKTVTGYLTDALKREKTERQRFQSREYQTSMRQARSLLKTKNRERFEKALSKILEQEPSKEARMTIERSKETGSWLSVQPLNVRGTVLSAQEFRDSLSIQLV